MPKQLPADGYVRAITEVVSVKILCMLVPDGGIRGNMGDFFYCRGSPLRRPVNSRDPLTRTFMTLTSAETSTEIQQIQATITPSLES